VKWSHTGCLRALRAGSRLRGCLRSTLKETCMRSTAAVPYSCRAALHSYAPVPRLDACIDRGARLFCCPVHQLEHQPEAGDGQGNVEGSLCDTWCGV
jgi:hypothetical protein